MQIVSLSNHIVRKALCLSLNEMAVLCDIKQMSQNPEYGYTCIKSKEKIADWLDLSRATVFNAIKTLETRGYIERTDIGIKPTKFIYDLDLSQEEIGIYIQRGDLTFITKKVESLLDGQSKIYTDTVQNLDSDRLKFRLPPSKIYTQDIHRDTHIEKKENNTGNIDFGDWSEAMHVWIDYRKKIKKPLKTERGIMSCLNDLKKVCTNNPQLAMLAVEYCMNKEWQGIYAPKEPLTGPTNTGLHVDNEDYKLGKKRYRRQHEFALYADYVKNCQQYGHTIKPEGHNYEL
jgi:DNA-binding PadR family transcriptional regulator